MTERNQLYNQDEKGLNNMPPVVRLALVPDIGYRLSVWWFRAACHSSPNCWAPAVSGPGRRCWDLVMGKSQPVPRARDAPGGSQAHRVSDAGVS